MKVKRAVSGGGPGAAWPEGVDNVLPGLEKQNRRLSVFFYLLTGTVELNRHVVSNLEPFVVKNYATNVVDFW